MDRIITGAITPSHSGLGSNGKKRDSTLHNFPDPEPSNRM